MDKAKETKPKKCMRKFFGKEHWIGIALFLLVYDIIAVTGSYFVALWLRFDCRFSLIPGNYYDAWIMFSPFYAAFCVICFYLLRMYKSIWRFASYSELIRTIISSFITAIFHGVFITIFIQRMPLSYYFIGAIIQFVLVIGVRFSYRVILLLRKEARSIGNGEATNVMLIGAGSSGQLILRDINRAKELNDKVVCIIDDNKNKVGRYIDGIPIVGGREDILSAVEKYNVKKIVLAMPSATMAQRRDILNICKETDCELKNLPGIYQLVNGEVSVSNLKNVSIEDLLGREPIKVEMEEVFSFIQGKTVLVTGGGARARARARAGAGCIIGTTQAKPYFTRVPEDCNIKSMYINGGIRNLITYKTKLLAV